MRPIHSHLCGTGSYLPPRRLSNADLCTQLGRDGIETSADWIVERTGIESRYFVDPEVYSSDLALHASLSALAAAGLGPQDIDLIIVATSTPDMVFPSTACILQRKLALTSPQASGILGAAAFDVQAVCTGFIYALGVADAMLRTGSARRALVVGAEVFSRLLDFSDRSTCVLFGDGAGAVVLQASEQPGGILATELHADGRHVEMLCVPGHVQNGRVLGDPVLKMEGQAVFKLAVNVLGKVAHSVLDKAGLEVDSIDWLIPHQANIRIIQSVADKLGIPMEKVILTLQEHGNTSAASIPLALDTAVRQGRILAGQNLLLEGVGGGFTWGAALIQYNIRP